MNKSLIKFITDFGPLLIFFVFYYKSGKDLRIAIPPFIVATIITLVIVWFLEKKVPMVPLLGGIIITFAVLMHGIGAKRKRTPILP